MQDAIHDNLPPVLNVDNLANGAVYELLSRALKQVADNILDPNTSSEAKRKIKIEIVASPFPDRSGAVYTVAVTNSLAGTKPAEGTFYLVRRGAETLVVSRNHKQMEMELQAAPTPTEIRPS